jgi:hypothetical protein
MTDNLKLGQIITTPQQPDAIHIAVAPVVAAVRLQPGQHIGFVSVDTVGPTRENIGIVDPYLTQAVKPGERFWMFLYPYTITSLRHEWSHPAMPTPPTTERRQPARASRYPGGSDDDRRIVQDFADEVGLSFDAVMDGAIDHLDNGGYLTDGGRWEGQGVPDRFWDAFEHITGRRVGRGDRYSFFSCSC